MSHRARFLMVAIAVAAICASVQAVPPAITIPQGLRSGDLLPVHEKQITDRVKWWLNAIRMANKNDDVVEYRKKLLDDYSLYSEPAYRQQFAEIVVEQAPPFLSGEIYGNADELREVKRINVAMGLSKMTNSAIQPLLQAMIAGDNAAIRFFGWSGYQNIRLPLMTGGSVDKDLLQQVSQALAEEPSPVVLSEVYTLITIGRAELPGFDDDARKQVAAAFMPPLQATWATRLEQMPKDDSDEMIATIRIGVQALATYRNEEVIKTARKLVLNAAQAAAKMYDAALRDANSDRVKASVKLLEACEQALLDLTPLTQRRIAEGLNADAPGAAVQLAVLDWQTDLEAQQLLPAEKPEQ